jgi:hypothetical protein
MKKTLMLLGILVSGTVMAQNISGGVKAGANVSNFTGGDFSGLGKKVLIGFHAGAYLNFGLGPVAIQPEVLVSTGGAKFEDIDEEVKLTYVSIPVMVQFKPGGGFYLEAGPQVGFKISEDIGDSNIEDFAKDLDLGVAAGLGYSFGKIGIGGRYIVGLSKVGDFDDNDLNPDFKNSTIQLGLFLRLGK